MRLFPDGFYRALRILRLNIGMATTSDDMRIIRQYFIDNWQSSIPFIFDNEPLLDQAEDASWARFSVRANLEKTVSITPLKKQESGRVYLHVFIPKGEGDAAGQATIDAFKASFDQLSLDNYRIRFKDAQSGFDDTDPKWLMLSATIQYRADR